MRSVPIIILLIFTAAIVVGMLLPDFRFDALSVILKLIIFPTILGIIVGGRKVHGLTVLQSFIIVLFAVILNVLASAAGYAWIAYGSILGPFGLDKESQALLPYIGAVELTVGSISLAIARLISRRAGKQ